MNAANVSNFCTWYFKVVAVIDPDRLLALIVLSNQLQLQFVPCINHILWLSYGAKNANQKV